MQYHIDDYRAGDPDVKPALPGANQQSQDQLPTKTDVLIVGCGPAGLTLAAQLAVFPDIELTIVDQRDGPLERGQADGVACRTMEMFNAFGFVHKVLREAHWVNETSFWRTHEDTAKGIYRSGQVADTEPGLSEFPHVILNQARIQELYLDIMRNSPRRTVPYYSRSLLTATRKSGEYPVHAELSYQQPDGSTATETIQAKYLVGCDGARSQVRRQMGLKLRGDSANQAWGVMDVLAVTDFPDNRRKAIINADGGGTVVLIPREGGYLFRLYVEMDKLAEGERIKNRTFEPSDVIAAANRVFHPYKLDVKHVPWWSVYEIGQRMTDRFDDVAPNERASKTPRIFIAGDACHTHSPKAGQGMNVSMQDSFNLGWKLAAVLQGRSPETLLHSYNEERHAVAHELIEFDKDWASLLHRATQDDSSVSAEEVQEYFVRSGHYTAGTATHYVESQLTGGTEHQQLASGLVPGKRFHSSPIVRLIDAKPMQLGHILEADGRWRIIICAPKKESIVQSIDALDHVCEFLEFSRQSPIRRFTPDSVAMDSVIDVRAVIPYFFRDLEISDMPEFLLPRKGQFQLRDYEKLFCFGADDDSNFYSNRGIDENEGCLIVVRPDQYVSKILPFNAVNELGQHFSAFMIEPHNPSE